MFILFIYKLLIFLSYLAIAKVVFQSVSVRFLMVRKKHEKLTFYKWQIIFEKIQLTTYFRF